ncbi:MAG: PQQ-binding-like beta-propeller repeat protein [Fimbriimonadales bacterium]|nr:PQQ-binding-like beta-propeller repeat protein [Fimbriimonadales bacterium]
MSVGILCTLWSWSQLQPGSPWPSLGKDYRNTRKTTLGAPTNGSVRWMYIEREDRARCSPVIAADGTIYYGTSTALYAVRPNGTRRWIFSNGLSMAYSTPAIGADGTIYTIANPQDAQLVAINPNGTLRWSLYLGGTDVYSSPAIGPDGFIYVTNGAIPGGYLYCIHPNGTVRWRLFLDVEVNSTPCFGEDGTIYVGSANYLNAVSPNGTLLWRYPVYYPVRSTIVRVGNRLFFGAWDSMFRAVSTSGQLVWQALLPGVHEGGGASDDAAIYVPSLTGELRKYTPSGVLQWRAGVGARYTLPAIGADGTLYVVGHDGVFFALSSNNALLRWSYTLRRSTPISGAAIGADGTVYLVEGSGRLYAFGPLSGFLMGGADVEGWEGDYEGLPVTVQFYQEGELKYEMQTTLDEEGRFTLENTPVGVHDIKVRVHRSLTKTVPEVHLEEDRTPEIRVILGNGDLNSDNVVDDADLLMVLMLYGEYNLDYDLTGDGYVDDAELLIVLFNFGATGE